MDCASCGATNPEGKKFCGDCGAALNVRCSSCGSDNPPGNRFCGDCGASLTPVKVTTPRERASAPAERRQLTVMFCDLVGSTGVSAGLDPEEFREVITAYQEACAEVIGRFDGVVAKHLGDGLLVYFGYPQAHEDDAERAVRAGLGIVDAVARLNVRPELTLRTRVGIATGLVVAGDIVGERISEERAVLGDIPNLAARLQELAEPNTVIIADRTRRLVGGLFESMDLGAHEVKGIAEPVQAWRVIAERGVESRFEATRSPRLTGFVGREQEIALLLDRWQQAKAGEGQAVLLSGEAGIGKSRITQALREHLANEPHTRLRYQCSPYHTNSALHPVIRQLEFAARLGSEDTADDKLDKLAALVAQSTETVAETVGLLAALMSIPAGDRYPLAEMPAQQQKEKTLEALSDQLVGLAEKRPVLFVLEDAHWIDPTTLELMELVVDRVQDLPVLVLMTCRPVFSSPWAGRTHVTSLALNRLARRQCVAMVEEITRGKPLPREVLDQIIAKTDGVPLFVEELTKTVLESELLEGAPDRYILKRPLPQLAIPATLRDSLMARLDRLSPIKEVAQIGAAIGRTFPYELIAAVSPMGDSDLEDALDRLARSELIFRRGVPPKAIYTFKHALVQDAAYESLIKTRRHQIHARIAHGLEEYFPETIEAEPEALARHYTEAGLVEQAIPYWHKAGQHASERSANLEAIAHCTAGLSLVENLRESEERARQELALQITLGPALMSTRGLASPEAEKAYVRARELCRRVGEPLQLFTVTWGLWLLHQQQGRLEPAQRLTDEVLALAEKSSDKGFRLQAHHAAWTTLLYCGELTACRDHTQRGISLYDPEEHRSHAFLYGGHDPGVCARTTAAVTLWLLGYPDQALAMAHDAVRLGRELAHPFSLAMAQYFVTQIHQFRREVRQARDSADVTTAICEENGFAHFLAQGAILKGWAMAAEGRPGDGIPVAREGLEASRAAGTQLRRSYYLAVLAEAYKDDGEIEQGLKALGEALDFVDNRGERRWEVEIHRLKGELLLSRDKDGEGEAEKCFRRAIEIGRRQSAKSLELRAAVSLARLWQRRDKAREARDLLEPVYSWFTEAFDTPDLREARALLDQLE
ncbi:MAG: AAA family ATPase [Alphaproteobacteria bacterium]